MKHLILKAAVVSGLTFLAAGSSKAQQDTISGTVKSKKFDINYGVGISINEKKDSTGKVDENKGRFVGGITFTRVDIGLVKLIDNGSFTLSNLNEFLDYKPWKTSTFSFDVLQFGYRFNNVFKAYFAAGFDWTHIRLDRDITIQKNAPILDYTQETIKFSKNRFSSSYLHIPLNLEFRSKENADGKRFRFVVGPEIAFLLGGKVKQVSDENGKVKIKDDYHFIPFRYGGTARIAYGGFGIFAKYTASNMFDTDAQKGLKSMAFGVTFGLN